MEARLAEMRESFGYLCSELDLSAQAGKLFDLLDEAYSQPWRAYHNWEHIFDCLQRLSFVRFHIEQPQLVEFALYFHDAIYDVARSDNEARSARFASDAFLDNGGIDEEACQIYSLIEATQHNTAATESDACYMVDIDLAILGSDKDRFELFEEQIRREYQHIKSHDYYQGRGRIFEKLLSREAIFFTSFFRDSFEKQARENLENQLSVWESMNT